MFVHNDFRLFAGSAKTIADKIDFGLHHGKIVLRSPLQNETCAQRRKVGNASDVQEHVLWEHRSEAGKNFLRLPPLALEIHNIGLHEDGAAIAKYRHRLRGKGQVRVLIYVEAEAFRGRLQEVSIPGGTLGIQLEILHAAVMQNDDFDVLAAHVDDYVWIVIELQRGFGVRDRLHQSNVRFEDVFQNILGVPGGCDAEYF